MNSDLFMDMLSSKEIVIKGMLKDIQSSQKNMAAFEKLEALYSEGKKVSADKALEACAKSLRHTNQVNQKLLTLLLMYISVGDYDADSAKMLNKMGRGKEALQQMWKNKFGDAV